MSSVSDDANNNSDPLKSGSQIPPQGQTAPAEGRPDEGAKETKGEGNPEGQAPQPVAPVFEHRLDKELNFVDLLQIVKRHIILIIGKI